MGWWQNSIWLDNIDGEVLSETGAVYFGEPSQDDTWRIIRDNNNLVFQRLESGTWTTKNTITP